MTKAQLRKQYMQKRQTLSEEDIAAFSNLILTNFIDYFEPQPYQKIHIFLSISNKREVETQFFLDYFFKNDIEVFVPKIFDGKLISVQVSNKTEFVENSWGILEPRSNIDSREKSFDFIFTPLLYSDQFGNRVGYGKGFYDQFFLQVDENCKKIGVNFFEPDEIIDDIYTEDVALDYLVTPTKVLSFKGFSSKFTK